MKALWLHLHCSKTLSKPLIKSTDSQLIHSHKHVASTFINTLSSSKDRRHWDLITL